MSDAARRRLRIVALSCGLLAPSGASGHPGDLDTNGGHVERRTGLYHYHRESHDERVHLPSPVARPGSADPLDVLVEARQFVGECVKVLDGDSILVMKPVESGRVGTHIRLAGLDAPESRQPGAEEARRYLGDTILHRTVYVDVRGSDGRAWWPTSTWRTAPW